VDRHFLVVAAERQVREALASGLRERGATVTLADSGAQAERVVQGVGIDTALIETHLPDTSAAELRKRLMRIRPECRAVVLTSFHTVRNTPEMLRFGLADYLLRADQILELVRPADAEPVQQHRFEEPASQALVRVIDVLVGMLELDEGRFDGSSHVAMELARATAEELDADAALKYEVVLGTLLRDVGRVGSGRPRDAGEAAGDEASKRRIEEHVMSSLRFLEHIEFPWKVLQVVRHHHEHYNGTGVPDGLRGREIPMGSRIVAVVDCYVGLTAGPDEAGVAPEDALLELARRTGHEFDPEVVEAFLRVMDKRLAGRRATGKPIVVLVDRDPKFRRVLKVRLGNVGLKVREADDYERCKELLLKESADLVLIGIDDGADAKEAVQLLGELQQDEALCRIPIAFLSSLADRALELRALRHGVEAFLPKADNMEALVARVENILIRGAIRAEGDARRTRRGITGSLENLCLADIVQTLTIGMKTACVTLSSAGRTGRLWFENGAPRHAECDQRTGEEAFYEMVRWSCGEFVIEHGAKARHTTIQRDGMFLLMEGLRMIDEDQAQAAS
jgi:response regulator RpfG family c-di-GMP phosphodiesterase